MSSSQRGQKSISSFFAKASPQQQALRLKDENAVNANRNGDLELPDAKRRRTASPATDAPLGPSTTDRPVHAAQSPKSDSATRTSEYLYTPSLPLEHGSPPDLLNQDERKKKLHEDFVKKLGKPDSIADIKRRNRATIEVDNEDADAQDEDEEAMDDLSADFKTVSKGKKMHGANVKKASSKLTPMEKQVLEIKRAHLDTLLVVEVGYKFRFFGEDARVAAKELSIVCIPGRFRYDDHPSETHLDRFASASIPVHRLHVHVKRLVTAGHKVGVVRQLETAALKAVGDNRNAPFVRKLTNVYTKGTYIDDLEGLEDQDASSNSPPATGFLLCLTETNAKGWGNDEKVQLGLLAVQPATGDIIYDDFEDGFMRTEIETRLLHLGPCELIVVGELSKATEKMIEHFSGSKTNVFGDKVRVERIPKQKTIAAQAFSHVSSFYASRPKQTGQRQDNSDKLLSKVLNFSENVSICLSAMIQHLQEYGLEHVFDLTKYFQPFASRSHMLLNGNTLASLEIYQNQTDHTSKGSLFWTLDTTSTRFGQRLMRKWVGRPLLEQHRIEERLNAVEELLSNDKTAKVEQLRTLLARVRIDLEKSLIRIYYGRCSRSELLSVLQSLQNVASEFAHIESAATVGFTSSLLSEAILGLPSILSEVVHYLDTINLDAAKSDDRYAFFREEQETDAISEHKMAIARVEQSLDAFRMTAAEKLGKTTAIDYVTVAGIEYLIEVNNASSLIKRVPASWIKVSGTKANSRFHPPEILKLTRERDQHKEALAAACDDAFKELLADIASKYQLFRDCIQNLATLDCLLALSTVAQRPGYVKPTFTNRTAIHVKGARHPMVEQLLLDAYVPNDIHLSHDSTRALLITGPNMGGKSSYVRSVALICIMAQVGSYVPASTSAKLGLFDTVFTRMGAFDNMLSGESTFMVELAETAEMLKMATSRSLVILDELGRGTSTHDGVAIAQAVLDYMVRDCGALTLFITHYQTLATMADAFPRGELKNVHVRFAEHHPHTNGADDNSSAHSGAGDITFLYEIGEGTAHRSYGLNVARLANIPTQVIRLAVDMSREMEMRMKMNKLRSLAGLLVAGGDEGGDQGERGAAAATEEEGDGQSQDNLLVERLDSIVEGIEQL